ncbi:AraC family transcriptional regulator [Alkalihalobacillus trypoxylicola]|uniref:Transcriptional regulator n=1 Tax=Alkalihalobacillus trypoxylicola TaxID=519424 RepID=A0A161PJL0_9BACI|nr:helix-turn-helix domain-containing protein [Alkalihalobacillus trypoxylicola]KYG29501.1 transcriptional regulator [Alkalihalobacillus trypoxylicola]GAF63413.1 putative DNA-binding protein [Bacillus sp. TS-2]
MDTPILRHFSPHFYLNHTKTEKPVDVATHIHDCYELFYFISGDLTYYIEGQAYQLSPHDMILTNSKELHRIVFNSSHTYERKFIHFTSEYISAYQIDEYNMLSHIENRKLGHFNRIPASFVKNAGIDTLWENIEKASREQSLETPILIKSYFIQLLIKINNQIAQYNNKEELRKHDDKIIAILEYINKNLEEKITLDLLEQQFYVNKYYLCHIFKKSTGFTVIEYITYKRIMKASELLTSGYSALDASHSVGFHDYSAFYKAFKKITGVSPKQLKEH